MKQYHRRFVWLSGPFALLLPSVALGHSDGGMLHGFGAGLYHPFSGIDHLVAMIAIGLWSAQLGGRARWLVPASFMLILAGSGLLAMQFSVPPFWFEGGIVLSLLISGMLVATATRLPAFAGAMLVGLFAFTHGHAHGTEIPPYADSLAYVAGFVCTSAFLHGLGVWLAHPPSFVARRSWHRIAGTLAVLSGLASWSIG